LGEFVADVRVSSFHETEPVDMPGSPAPFLNAAAVGKTGLSASDLLDRLLDLEQDLGRERPHPGASRTLDLDLILYGHAVIDQPPRLVVPHPRFRARRFVLAPLVEVAADWTDPVTRRTVAELLRSLDR
jgi:2-amino-4-hydroxy-6-hydroxymethyldihydropteridine diphosphokinase